jgi:TolA-binding protein
MMSAADHFLETFERRRRGTASREELTELEAHALVCPSCALELSLMNDLAVGRDAPSSDFFADERAVAVVLRKLDSSSNQPRRPRWILALSAVLVAGAATAAGGVLLKDEEGARVDAARAQAAAPNVGRPPVGRAVATPPPSPVAAAEPVIQPTDQAPAASVGEAVKASSAEPETAAQLFAKANQLRRQGKDALATEAYRELQRRFASSAEARQAMVTLGWLLLDRARPSEALQQFELYLKRGGAASEDALVGQALAQQRLGRAADERRTLAALVARYPASANAARAKKRLAELE